jgi:hypothetical protein
MSEQSLLRITCWSDMEGKTIRSVFKAPSGEYGDGFDAVLVFDDKSWAAASIGGSEDAYLELDCFWQLTDIDRLLSVDQLLIAELINTEQAKLIRERDEARESERKSARAVKLRAELERLEADLRD